MSIEKYIKQIEELENASVLKSKDFIAQYGWEKLKEALTLYYKGLGFGIPSEELKKLFEVEVQILTQEVEITQEAPTQEVEVVEDEALEEPVKEAEVLIEEQNSEQQFFLNNERIHKALYALSNNGIISIMSNQICELAGVEQTKGNLKKISQGLELAGFKSKYVSNPLKFTRTRANQHQINLNDLTENLKELWSYLNERRDKGMKLPIKLEDYLDGTEGAVKLKRDREDLFITFSERTFDAFKTNFMGLLEKVYGDSDQLVAQGWIENTNLNKYLLSEALLKAYPPTTLHRLVKKEYPQLNTQEVEGTTQYLREYLNEIQVKVGLLSENWSSIDTAISGFVYLIAIMSLNYHMDQ